MPPEVEVGLELYRLYAEEGRSLPAAWIARAVGVSPTTMTKYLTLHCPDYAPRKGWVPGQGWNWSRSRYCRRVRRMIDNKFSSNGKQWECDEEPPAEEIAKLEETGVQMGFEEAMELVEEGMAVLRLENCKRVIFRGEGNNPLVGTTDETSKCTPEHSYMPTFEDIKAKDWAIDAHPPLTT